MSEETKKTTAAKSTSTKSISAPKKKGRPAKSTATKAETKAAKTVEVVEEVVVVDEVTTSTPAKAPKEFKMTDTVRCKSVRQNEVYLVGNSGVSYRWAGYGDIREVAYGDLQSLKAARSRFLYEPWVMILDEDIMERTEYKDDFSEMYKVYEAFDSPKEFFEKDITEIRETLKNAPNGFKDLIIFSANDYVNRGILNRLDVINEIDRLYGTTLKQFI